jgi:hypothetical protein
LIFCAAALAAQDEAVSLPVSLGPATDPPQFTDNQYPGFSVHYGIVPGTDLEALAGKTVTLGMKTMSYTDPATGKHMLRGYGEAHALCDVPMAALEESIWDFVGQKKIFPKLLDVKVEELEADRAKVYQRLGISVLGIGVGYKMRIEVCRDHLSPSAIGTRSRLLECPDGNMFESYSSWYLQEVVVNGKTMTYMRLFSSPGISDPFPGTATIVQQLTPGELRNSIDTTVSDARRRIAAGQ